MIKLKKIGLVIVASIFIFAAFAVCGCRYSRNYRWSEDSFSLEMSLSREYAREGDEITISTTFRNLSGRNLRVKGIDATVEGVEEFVLISIVPYGEQPIFLRHPVLGDKLVFSFLIDFYFVRSRIVIAGGPIFVEPQGVYQIFARAAFMLNEKTVMVYATPKILNIRGEKQ